jgi:hypothetical protein
MMLLKLKTYAGIPLAGITETTFDLAKPQFANWAIEYQPQISAVKITHPIKSGSKDFTSTYVPTANVAYFTELKLNGKENREATSRIAEAASAES